MLNILRVNNDLFCDLAALVLLDDSVPGAITAKYVRLTSKPLCPSLHSPAPNVVIVSVVAVTSVKATLSKMMDVQTRTGPVLTCLRANHCSAPCAKGPIKIGASAEAGLLWGRFLRYKNVPGLAVGHPAILYDSVSDLYWMASNVNRDSGDSHSHLVKETVL